VAEPTTEQMTTHLKTYNSPSNKPYLTGNETETYIQQRWLGQNLLVMVNLPAIATFSLSNANGVS